MGVEIKQIAPISEETAQGLRRASAYKLPNNPSERGMKADDIRKAFYTPIIDGQSSLAGEIDRVVKEVNESFELLGESVAQEMEAMQDDAETLQKQFDEHSSSRESHGIPELIEAHNASAAAHRDIRNVMRETGEALAAHAASLAWGTGGYEDPHQTREAIAMAKNEIISSNISPINAKLNEHSKALAQNRAIIDTNRKNIFESNTTIHNNSERILAVESQLSGVTRSYAFPDFASFISFMNGERSIKVEDSDVYVWQLVTGDNILVIEHNTADFWFHRTSDVSAAETYTYGGVEYELIARDANGTPVGLMHVAETDYSVIEGQVISVKQSAAEAKDAAKETEADREAVEKLVNSIFYVQKAPTLEHINDAIMLPTPTLAMLSDGIV